jgi:hypothetical protein
VHRDYGPKGVKFFFVYKTLAHPELVGGYIQPFTLDERLAHARQAEKQLGATIPWLVDGIDNRLKHALGDRPNSEFIIDPQGLIVSKRAWSNPAVVRQDLEKLVGTVDPITKAEDVQLNLQLPLKTAAVTGIVPRIDRSGMQAIVSEPTIEPGGLPFFAKLRAEADAGLFQGQTGKLYLGLHLDPFHNAHWNNLTKPLSIELDLPDGVQIEPRALHASPVAVTSDADPREFLLDVKSWPSRIPIRLTVKYFACVGETSCHAVQQHYTLHLRRDRDAGGARGPGAGFWKPEAFTRQMMARDRNRDGKLNRNEVQGLVLPHFDHFDTNQDGLLDPQELKAVSDWLNHHHQPGVPKESSPPRQP